MFYIDGVCYVDGQESTQVDINSSILPKCLSGWLKQSLLVVEKVINSSTKLDEHALKCENARHNTFSNIS